MSIRATFHYFQGMECDMYSFYRIPKLLFTSEYFKNLSCEAKVLYGLMLDRMSLSIKNRWFDEEDRAYIFFSVEEIMEMLNCGRNKAVNCLKELDQEKGIGLIEKRRIGLGKTNVIYVKNFSLTEYPDEPAIFDSEETPENVAERKENTETEIEEKYRIIEEIKNQANKLEVKKSKIDVELEQIINKMWEDYEITPNTVGEYKKPNDIAETTKNVKDLREKIKELGSINIDSIEEYKQTKERYDYMCEQRLDLENSSNKLKKVIQDMTKIMKEQFEAQFKTINKNFGEVFKELFGGGKAELRLTDEEDILNCGIEIEVQPPGKKLQNMSLLSGGERAFTAIALLFAILKINPAPFCVLDEIEAALDDVNVYRFADYLKKFTQDTQFLVITHRKGTMEASDTVYGITMEESGISKLLSMKLEKK